MGGIFETAPELQPLWWIGFYIVFVALNVVGVELSFKVTLAVTLLALACLVVFWVSAIPHIDFSRWALDIPAGGVAEASAALTDGSGPFLPKGLQGVLAAMPFAVWLFLAIEQLPLAAEESVDPRRDMPKGIIAGIFTLIVSAFMILWLNASVAGIGSYALSSSGEPLLDGFKAIYGDGIAKVLSWHCQGAFPGRCPWPDCQLPHHHFCQGPTDLLAEPRRILSVWPVDHAWQPQDAACGNDCGFGHRPCCDVRAVVLAGFGTRRRGDRRNTVEHGGIRRDVLLHHAGAVLH